MFCVNKSPVNDNHFWMWCPTVINVKGTYVNGKISLPTRVKNQSDGVQMSFVCKHMSSDSNFVITEF